MPAHRKSRLAIITLALLGLCFAGVFGAYLALRQPAVQNYLAQNLTRWLGLNITARQIGIDLNQGLAIQAREIQFHLPGDGGQLNAAALSVGLKIAPLLKGDLAPQWIVLHRPRISVTPSLFAPSTERPRSGEPGAGLNRPLHPPWHFLPATLRQVRIDQGTLAFGELSYTLVDLELDLRIDPITQTISRGRASFALSDGMQTAAFVLEGSLELGHTLAETVFSSLQVDFRQLPLAWFPWPGFLPCDSGLAAGRLTVQGQPGQALTARGSVNVDQLKLRLQRNGRRHLYDLAHLPLYLETRWQAGRWRIGASSPNQAIFPLKVDWLWDFTTRPRPAMDLKVTGGPMPLSKFKALYPAPVTTPWLDQALFPALEGGTVDLREFRIHGRLDQLRQLKDPDHRERLKLDLDLEQSALFRERPGLPLEAVSARVLIDQGRLSISDLKGGFGDSRIEGADFGIRDLYHTPLTVAGNLQGQFDLKDIHAQTPAFWFSAPARQLFAPLAAAQGPLRADTAFRIRCGEPLTTTLWGTFDLGPAQLRFKALETPIDLEAGRLTLLESGEAQFEAQGSLADSEFNIKGRSAGGLVTPLGDPQGGWNARVQGVFDLPSLLAGGNRDVLKSLWPDFHARAEDIRGELAADFQIVQTAKAGAPQIRQGSFTLHEGCLAWRDSPWTLGVTSGELSLAPDAPAQLSGMGDWGPHAWHAQGEIHHLQDSARRALELDISGQADLPRLVRTFFPRSPFTLAAPAPLPARMNLAHSAQGLFLEGEVDLRGIALNHDPLSARLSDSRSRGHFQIERTPEGQLKIPRISLESGGSQVEAKGWLTHRQTGFRGFLEISADPFHLDDIELRLTSTADPLKGLLQLHTSWRLTPVGMIPAGPEGIIRFRDLGLSWPKLAQPIRDSSLDLRLSREALRIASGRIQVGQSPLNISGRFTGWAPLKGALTVRGRTVRIADLYRPPPSVARSEKIDAGPAPGPRLPGWLAGGDLRMEIAIDTLLGDQLTSGPLEAGLSVSRDVLALQRVILDFRPGTFILTGRIPNAPQKTMRFGGYLRTEKIPSAALLPLVKLEPKRLDAQLSLEGSYIAQGLDRNALIGGLDGNFSMELNEGTTNSSTVLFRILDLLSLQNLVLQRMPEIGEDTFYFNKASADFEIRKGVAATENFILRSPVFNAAGRGELDLARRIINFDLGAQPLGSVDNLLSWIPIVGHILTGPEKALLVYYFHITGPFKNPQLQHVPFKNLGSGLVGYFERIFTTPPRLLRKAADFTRAFLGQDGAAGEDETSTEGGVAP